MNAVDTNVYVYSLDVDEAAKQAKALELFDQLMLRRDDTVLLWRVASEFLNQLRRWESNRKLTGNEVEAAFQRSCSMFRMQLPTEAVFQTSFQLRSRFSLSHWDSMLLAACKEAGVTTLYSEDMDAGTNYDGLSIVNPFA
jgi:predicted nucleic acid-binding protein